MLNLNNNNNDDNNKGISHVFFLQQFMVHVYKYIPTYEHILAAEGKI